MRKLSSRLRATISRKNGTADFYTQFNDSGLVHSTLTFADAYLLMAFLLENVKLLAPAYLASLENKQGGQK